MGPHGTWINLAHSMQTHIRRHRENLSWIESPIDEKDGEPAHLYRNSDATPVELFFDLFFVANLSTFTATHEINNVEGMINVLATDQMLIFKPALGAYIGFLGVIWFTWLQVTLFDIRFARDSIFERGCKAVQLGVMVGFASAGTRFTTRVRDENVWAFQSLSFFLAGSRVLLAIQYTVNIFFVHKKMKPAAKGMSGIAATLFISSLVYLGVSLPDNKMNQTETHILTFGRCTLPSYDATSSVPTYGPFGLCCLDWRCGSSWGCRVLLQGLDFGILTSMCEWAFLH